MIITISIIKKAITSHFKYKSTAYLSYLHEISQRHRVFLLQ